ncbi:MAG: hypothetical protein WDO13_03595 [Verrucomicrobiota bacterium]
MRLLLAAVSLALLGMVHASAQQQREDIVLTGGCALRFMEHGKGEVSHDVYWFNFVDASTIWLKEVKDQHPGDIVTWLVYRPAYASRSVEMGLDLIKQLQDKANALGVRLVFFNTKEELIAYLNRGFDRKQVKIAELDYFGIPTRPAFSSTTATSSTPCRSRGCM